MKKLFIIFMVVCFSGATAQTQPQENHPIQNLNANIKGVKQCLVFSGSMVAIGAITNVVRTYQQKPQMLDYRDYKDYLSATSRYKEKQINLQRVSGMFYGAAGIGLIVLCFNF
ncbi:MAG: hypothetical protein JWP12_319 [Bacteroidetes bacterium]|nr:hypothetical protein [Bacteroidota bacterium]